MKTVILSGGLGTRLGEETAIRPKPLVEIGGRPIIWHIMKIYSYYGINDFVILLGYKGYMIKEFFDNYRRHLFDMRLDFKKNKSEILRRSKIEEEKWKIELVDTGENSMTGGRLKRAFEYLKDEDTFCLTYGDGVSNINVKEEIKFHKKHGKIATIGAVFPPAKYGAYINGGFFVLNKEIFNYLEDDSTIFEQKPLGELSKNNQLMAFKHEGFWQCMDTQREKALLEEMWNDNKAPWKLWK